MAYRKIMNDLIERRSLFQKAEDAIIVVLSGAEDGDYMQLKVVMEKARIDSKKVQIESVLLRMVQQGLINKDKDRDGTIILLTSKGRNRANRIKAQKNLNLEEEVW